MNFLYDLTAIQPKGKIKFAGGESYAEILFFKILENYDALKSRGISLFAAYNSRQFINPVLLAKAKDASVHLIDIEKESPYEIFEKYKITRFYSALLSEFTHWNLDYCKTVVTVHGLRGLEMPLDIFALKYSMSVKAKVKYWLNLYVPFFKARKLKKEYCGYSRFFDGKKKIVTVSQHSKASILSYFPIMKPEDIKVFASPSFDSLNENIFELTDFSEISKTLGIERKKYFLITSGARWMKNTMRAVLAFDELFHDGKISDMKVVITGVTDKNIFEKRIRYKEKFIMTGFVERNELEALNQNAYCFVFPTLNEGFGYPPVEAMKYATPSICSGTASMPEVCESAALYFNPYSIGEIKNRIIQTTFPNLYETLCLNAKEQYEKISKKQKQDLDNLVKYLFSETEETSK